MTQPTRYEILGEVGYTAYSEAVGGLSELGEPMPPWVELPDPQRTAWAAAAQAIETKLTTPEVGPGS